MRISPKRFAHAIVTTPWLLCYQHRGILTIRLQWIGGAYVVPVDNLCCTTHNIVLVKALHDSNQTVEPFAIHVILAVPDGFSHLFGHRSLLGSKRYLAECMGTHSIDGIAQLGVALHVFHKIHLIGSPVVESMKFYVLKSALVHGAAQHLGKVVAPPFLVMAANGIEFEPVLLAQSCEPIYIIIGHVLRPEIAHPSRCTPTRGIKVELGIAALGFAQHPPGIATLSIEIAKIVTVRGHAALGTVAIARNLNQQRADRGAKLGLIHQV